MNMTHLIRTLLISIPLILASCTNTDKPAGDDPITVFEKGTYPRVVKDGDTYYYIMPGEGYPLFSIYSAKNPADLGKSTPTTVWRTDDRNFQHAWSPELHKIDGKWYIYFEADDGNTDNHHIYVLENPSEDPLVGKWTLHEPLMLNEEWNYGIHPSTFVVNGRQYLIWSGWEQRRLETETQCIFIAEMENPWTLKSKRVLLSRPEYEWERQWINPDGSRSAYPIFVNENPEAILSPDGKNVILNYSASGVWTVYRALGMLTAPAESDLLNPESWTKSEEPVFTPGERSNYVGASNVSFVVSPDGEQTLMLYQAKQPGQDDCVLLKPIRWENSLPVYGEY